MIKHTFFLLLLSCVVLGCQHQKPSAAGSPATTRPLPQLNYSDADNGKTVHIPERTTFNVSLESQPSTGFSWKMKPSEQTLFVSEAVENGGRPGAVQSTVFKLVGTGRGEDDIAFAYSIPSSSNTRVPNVARYFKMHVVYDERDPFPPPGTPGLARYVVGLDPQNPAAWAEANVKGIARSALAENQVGEVAGDPVALPAKHTPEFSIWVVMYGSPSDIKAALSKAFKTVRLNNS